MNCAEVMEWMHRYLDHDLSPDESLEMFRHIDNCPSCAELFERLNVLSKELEQLPDVSPPFSLVDSILPKLEAIDREAGVMAASPAEEPQAQPMSRKASRARNRSSSLAPRFGIGIAAAAVVLAIAMFNMPEKLPGAQVDEEMNSSAQSKRSDSTAGSSGDDAATKMTFGAEVGSSPGEENSTPADTGASIMAAPDSSSPAEGGQNGQGGGAAPKTADPAERSTDNRKGESAKSTSPGTEHSGQSEKLAPPSAAAGTSESPNADKELSDSQSDPMIPENTLQAPSFKDGAAGIMGIAPIETPPGSPAEPPSWTSPDGRYTAAIEGQKLVIYRAAGNNAEGRQAVDTISFEGAWVSGEWSADNRQFTYVTSAEGKELRGTYTVPQETPAHSAAPSASGSAEPASPPPSPSPSPESSTKQ
ncbi:zf-HC2 domain-containing protein [Paenibacillus sabinae]|uniref:Anti-sigma-W factor RsiW n=1 Tax=Paenibacillus sabinae T27 TaxID=1268072 RepID=X5A3R6_9BACL|nr:zf-HC2 domain-containing protein [Paenibacillus sabinae]AHV98474.1 putative transmembrane anti-sigma factor [Paenibacillus sabinae T27]